MQHEKFLLGSEAAKICDSSINSDLLSQKSSVNLS